MYVNSKMDWKSSSLVFFLWNGSIACCHPLKSHLATKLIIKLHFLKLLFLLIFPLNDYYYYIYSRYLYTINYLLFNHFQKRLQDALTLFFDFHWMCMQFSVFLFLYYFYIITALCAVLQSEYRVCLSSYILLHCMHIHKSFFYALFFSYFI